MLRDSMVGLQTTGERPDARLGLGCPEPLVRLSFNPVLSSKCQSPTADSNWLNSCTPALEPYFSRTAKPVSRKGTHIFSLEPQQGCKLEQKTVIISTKALSKLTSQGNNDQRDFLTRGVKNIDKLEATFAVVRDGKRESNLTRKWETRFAIHR